jgi:hypothetical protein
MIWLLALLVPVAFLFWMGWMNGRSARQQLREDRARALGNAVGVEDATNPHATGSARPQLVRSPTGESQ